MSERVAKLGQHFGQVTEDVRQVLISTQKIEQRGARIADVEFAADAEAAIIPAPLVRKLEAGE
jgi:DNA recombination protein RmuC